MVQKPELYIKLWIRLKGARQLHIKDRARILHLLIERVDYNGAESTVSISFRPNGIENLIEDHSHEETEV